MLERMKEAGFMPNQFTIQYLLHACSKNGDIQRAHTIVNMVHRSSQFEMNLPMYTNLINAYSKAQRYYRTPDTTKSYVQLAEAAFNDLCESGLKPDTGLLNALLSVYAEGYLVKQAQDKFVTLFKEHQQQPDRVTYTIMIKLLTLSRHMDAALELLGAVQSSGFEFDYYLYRHLLRGCAKVRPMMARSTLLSICIDSSRSFV